MLSGGQAAGTVDARAGAGRHVVERDHTPVVAYLPREVFFGRLGLADGFLSVWASDFGRFFPAKSGSFR
jgi:hypothetical protein